MFAKNSSMIKNHPKDIFPLGDFIKKLFLVFRAFGIGFFGKCEFYIRIFFAEFLLLIGRYSACVLVIGISFGDLSDRNFTAVIILCFQNINVLQAVSLF